MRTTSRARVQAWCCALADAVLAWWPVPLSRLDAWRAVGRRR